MGVIEGGEGLLPQRGIEGSLIEHGVLAVEVDWPGMGKTGPCGAPVA